MRDKIYNFMRTRYGNDQFSSFLTWMGLILIIIDVWAKTGVLYFLGLASFIYGYVRIFSKKYDKRAAENKWFLSHTTGVRNVFKRMKKAKKPEKIIRSSPAHVVSR